MLPCRWRGGSRQSMVFGPLNEVKHVSLPAGRGKLGEVF